MAMVSVDDALAHVVAVAPKPRRETVDLHRAIHRVLIADVHATHDQPPFDASAMDGYAVMAYPEPGNELRVIGESQAGHPFVGNLGPGEAVRIFTGAPMPTGAHRVILQENVIVSAHGIHPKPGVDLNGKPHVRLRGSDFGRDDVVLQAGDRLTPQRLCVAAAAGHARLPVARRPRIAILLTGDELVTPGGDLLPGQVYESTSPALFHLIEQWGGKVVRTEPVRDDRDALRQRLAGLKADLIVTLGGASVGDYDFVRTALNDLGASWLFDKVNIRPGKPTALARLPDGTPVLCLPGNPASALICAHLFLKTFIEAATGSKAAPLARTLPCAIALPANSERESFIRAAILTDTDGQPMLMPVSNDDSSHVGLFAVCTALIRRRPGAPAQAAGAPCECLLLTT